VGIGKRSPELPTAGGAGRAPAYGTRVEPCAPRREARARDLAPDAALRSGCKRFASTTLAETRDGRGPALVVRLPTSPAVRAALEANINVAPHPRCSSARNRGRHHPPDDPTRPPTTCLFARHSSCVLCSSRDEGITNSNRPTALLDLLMDGLRYGDRRLGIRVSAAVERYQGDPRLIFASLPSVAPLTTGD